MDIGYRGQDYPGGYRLELSANRREWTTIGETSTFYLPITAFLRPTGLRVELEAPGSRGRYLRIVQTGEDPVYYWSIHELNLIRR